MPLFTLFNKLSKLIQTVIKLTKELRESMPIKKFILT